MRSVSASPSDSILSFHRAGLSSATTGDWLSDPVQIALWQDELVNHCEKIRVQLSEIHSDLDASDKPFGVVGYEVV